MSNSITKMNRLGGAVYLLPNLLTTGNLFWGFFSIIKSLNGQFLWAASAIFLASIFDILDGRVARLTHSTSEFGVQYDSLCDLLSFGIAPAFLMYQYGLHELGRIGWIACFIYLACGALRLARFNVQSSIGKASGDFVGLPIPMAALTIASFVAVLEDIFNHQGENTLITKYLEAQLNHSFMATGFLLVMGLLLGVVMVSNFPYYSHKSFHIKGIKPFRLLAIFVICIGLFAYLPELIGFLFTFGFAVSGPLAWIMGWRKMTDDDEIFSAHSEGSRMEPGDD